MKTLTNWLVLLVITGLSVVALGLWARLMKELFCLGYGC